MQAVFLVHKSADAQLPFDCFAVFVLAFACRASVMWTAYIICQPPTVCMHASLPPPNSRCDSHRNEVHTHTTMAFVAEQREHHACTSQDEARCTHMHGAGIVQPPLACCNSCRGHNCKTLDSRHTEHSSTHPPATTSCKDTIHVRTQQQQ